MSRALEGLRVLDITHVLAGPFATYQLALLGADVIKLESPSQPDCARGRGPDDALNAAGLGLTYQVQGANKRSVAVDLTHPDGLETVLTLAATCDVLVENYRTGALDRLGLGPSAVAERAPGLIYCSITGYGDDGPSAREGAYDNVIQARSGTIDQSGGVKPGLSFVDYATGYAAAYAITAALVRRATTGKGAHISVSMLEVALSMMAPEAAACLTGGTPKPKEAGIRAYETADGILMLGAFRPEQYGPLGACLAEHGHAVPALSAIADWPDVWALPGSISDTLTAIFATATAEVWTDRLRAHGLPAAPVIPLADAVHDPQVKARDFFGIPPGGTAPVPRAAFHLDGAAAPLDRAAPMLGQHTDEILQGLGLSSDRIQDLRARGVIA